MNRFALTIVGVALFGGPALAQTPITGGFPPWITGPVSSGPIAIGMTNVPPTIVPVQPPPPYAVRIPAGDLLIGVFKLDGYMVGLDCWLPYDTGEFNLAGFAGNARYFGVFQVTLPVPASVDPTNASVRYFTCHGSQKTGGTNQFFRP
jgi:hypothetical protein